MAATYKRLGAAVGGTAITVPVTLYTAGGAAIVSSVTACNSGTADAEYCLSVGTTTGFTSHERIVNGAAIAPGESVFITAGITLDATNRYLLVGSTGTAVAFSAFGAEVS